MKILKMNRNFVAGLVMIPFALVLLVLVIIGVGASITIAQQPTMTAPQPTVPEAFTLEGEFVRIAYNNEGFVSLGYRMANQELGKEWVLLDVGVTLRKPTKDFTFKRDGFSLKTPDSKTIPLATKKEFGEAGYLANLNTEANMIRDSINYFPSDASSACALRFFSIPGAGPTLTFDQVDLSSDRACVGRIYFHVPGGIQAGQHYLNVQFAQSMVQVPFRVFTKAEEKQFRKKWEDLKKQHEATMKQ